MGVYKLHRQNIKKPAMMILCLLFVAIILGGVFMSPAENGEALSGSQFKPGRIIDDAVFYNKNAMSASQIQTFLNSKVPKCDTNRSKSSSPNDSGPPYICLKDYKQNTKNIAPDSGLCNGYTGRSNETAAQIIYNVAQSCGINPQVLLVMLQKEQSLITDTWPWKIQYDKAMGAFCPDTAPCDPQYAGFFYQVYYGAHRFKVYKANPDSFNYKAGRNNSILWHPNTACGRSTVYIENQATASLYIYTPYRPNQAALNNLYGSGDSCSSYGNRNFWRLFNDWFGSPIGPGFASALSSAAIFANPERSTPVGKIHGQYFLQPNQTAYARVVMKNTGRNTWYKNNTRLGTASPHNHTSIFATPQWLSPARPAGMQEDSVAPGGNATFLFPIKAPNSYNVYKAQFQVLVEGVSWATNYTLSLPINSVNPIPDSSKNPDFFLRTNESLSRGGSIYSPEMHSLLRLQHSGNLELYNNFKLVWQSNTSGSGATKLVLQSDGNLVLYSSDKAVWSSRTHGSGGNTLTLQSDGNLVLYSPTGAAWSTKTSSTNQKNSLSLVMSGTSRLYPGQRLYSPDRKRSMILQQDGNLVLYSSGKAVWNSRTFGKTIDFLTLQSDGNLVLYGNNGKPHWNSGTHGNGSSSLVLQQDGNLVLYSSAKATWHAGTRNK